MTSMHGQTLVAAVLLVLASGTGLRAQTSRADPVDLQSRLGAQVNVNLPRKWESSIGYEARMVDNSSAYRGSYFSTELSHPLGKRLKGFGNYRLARVTDAVSHRFGVGVELEAKKGPFTFSFRPTFQYQRTFLDDAEQGSREVLRARMRAKFPATRQVTLYASVEPYFAFAGVYPIDNWRNTAGVQWEFRKKTQVDLHYIYRPDYAKIYNRTYHIVGLAFSTDLKLPR